MPNPVFKPNSWSKVVIRDSATAGASATTMIDKFTKALKNAGAPDDCRAYHLHAPGEGHIYYFSPASTHAGRAVLQEFKGSTIEEPGLEGCAQIPL